MTTTIERQVLPPRDAMRTAPFALRDSTNGDGEPDDGLTLDGYAAVFNRVTVIDSWEGRFKEKVAPGAMKKSFRERKPVIQFDHGRHSLIGSIPIAQVTSVAEEVDPVRAPEGGAHVIARLHDNWLIQPLRDAIASGSIDGMSFRFEVVRETWHDAAGKRITDEAALRDLLRTTWDEGFPEDELPVRTLVELKVRELGPVVFPAYDDTSVGVRCEVIDLSRLDDPDQRSLLARAVLMADASEAVDAPAPDSPPATDPVSADRHEPEPNGAPQATSDEAGEHESQQRRDRFRMGRDHARDTVLTIQPLRKANHHG